MLKIVNYQIKKFIENKLITKRTILSNSFKIICEKITLNDNSNLIIKYYQIKNNKFNAIKSEGESLLYLNKKFPNLFPNVKYLSNELLIMNFINNDKIKPKNYNEQLAFNIYQLHKHTNKRYGFYFDSQIGGMKQSNKFTTNWVNFFKEKRMVMIFETINKKNYMPHSINIKIEKLINNLENFIPSHPKISLLHGDLWQGNILTNKKKIVSLIDPGIYFGHFEMEIAYLTWFKYIDKGFVKLYSNFIEIKKEYFEYEFIYQLYFSLLNVHLWSKEYIKDTNNLLNEMKI